MKYVKETIFKSVKIFGINYELKIIYKRIKNPKLDIKEKLIEISLPNKYKKNLRIISQVLTVYQLLPFGGKF